MKPSTLILCFAVWSISLATAYYIGSSGQKAPGLAVSPNTEKPITTTSKLNQATDYDRTSERISALDSYLSGENTTLDEALREIPTLSAQASRDLLNQAFARPVTDPNHTRLIRALLGQLAESEPIAALEIASQIESLGDSGRARESVLEVWAGNDPAAAMAWASSQLDSEPSRARNSQLRAIYRGFATSNPEAAFQQALQTDGDNQLKKRLLTEVIEIQIASGGIQAAQLAVDQVDDPKTKESLRLVLVEEWADFDPQAAAQYLLSIGNEASKLAKSRLIREWADSDPASAATWLSNLPGDDPAIGFASTSIILEWTRYDLAAPAEWLNSLPINPELDRAVKSYAYRAAEEDPEAAMTWANSIEDERLRTDTMKRVAAMWNFQDSDSFNDYLNSSNLTEEERNQLK